MKSNSKILVVILLTSFLTPAFAHTGLGHTHSFISGFVHPWSGVDHLLVMFAVGLYAVGFKGRAMLSIPVSFLLFMALGARLTYLDIVLPSVEQGIVSSLFILGFLLFVKTQLSRIIILPLIAYFALCHGYAHVIEMNPDGDQLLYLTGFVLSTAVLHLFGILAGRISINYLAYFRVLTGVTSIVAGTLVLAY